MNAFLESEKLKCAIKATPVLSIFNDYHKVYNVQSLKEQDKDSWIQNS